MEAESMHIVNDLNESLQSHNTQVAQFDRRGKYQSRRGLTTKQLLIL